MTKQKDMAAINNLILEMSKVNNWLSRDDLAQKTGKSYPTIKNYVKNEIAHLIDTQDFIEYVDRNTGKGKATIEKYKLKPNLDNLLAVFNYLNDKNIIKELMKTKFYRNQIFDIQDKVLKVINNTDNISLQSRSNIFSNILPPSPYNIDNISLQSALNKIVSLSPSAVLYILTTNLVGLKANFTHHPPEFFPNLKFDDLVYTILSGLFHSEALLLDPEYIL